MPESLTRDVGLDVHQDAMAVADVAPDHDAHVLSLGAMGPRPAAIAQCRRQRHSKANHLVVGDKAGPCGDWLSRYRRHTGDGRWVVAPAWIPHTAGDRVTTDRREAGQGARLRRSGELTPGSVPPRGR